MKPRTVFRLILVAILIALFVRNYLMYRHAERARRHETVQWVDTSTFGKTAQQAKTATHDLSADEAKGGHTLKRHVGKTDTELRERLTQERVSAASTYADRATAEAAVAAALEQNKERVESWRNKQGGHPNLVLDYSSDKPLGRTLHRGESESQPCSHAVVVLRFDPPNEEHVLTSYPQCGTESE
jgi:uncharacterized membrane protein